MRFYTESMGESFKISLKCKQIYSEKSKFQKIEVLENKTFGKILRLGGCFQISELDESLYHKSLVQPAMSSHKFPREVLIIGGGDGCSLREVLKYNSVDKITLVEIDKRVVEISRRFFSRLNKYSLEDKKVEVFLEDGNDFLLKNTNLFDIIILDLTDPDKLSKKLYSKEFYKLVSRRLKRGGIISLHAESIFYPKISRKILVNLKEIFKEIRVLSAPAPIYGGQMYFVTASLFKMPRKAQGHECNNWNWKDNEAIILKGKTLGGRF